MRIARPKRREVDFKRKRSPPPQATKLLTYSMIAGIVFIALLGIVFVPQALRPQPTTEVVNPENGGRFRLDTSNGTRLYVDSSTAALSLTEFNATFRVSNTAGCPAGMECAFAHLDPGLAGGNATLSFTDRNANGLLDSGDYFALRPPQTGCYRFEVYQVNLGKLAGFLRWGGGCL
jgi:hypothetical protein